MIVEKIINIVCIYQHLCSPFYFYLFTFKIFYVCMYLFIWLHQVLVAAHGIFSCGMCVRSTSLTRDQTQAPCIESAVS